MAPRVTWTAVEIMSVVGTTVTVGTPDEHGGMATLALDPPHVQPHFLPAVGSKARVLKVDNVPFLYPDSIAEDAITAREIIAGAISALLIQGDTIIAGAAAGAHVSIKGDGVRVYATDVNEGQYEASRWGSTGMDDFWSITTALGVSVASVSSLGSAHFSNLSSTDWPQIGAGDWTGVGGSLDKILDRRPRDLAGYVPLIAAGPGTTTATGWREFGVILHPGRSYRLSGAVRMKSTVAADVAQAQIRYTSAASGETPAQPGLTSPLLLRASAEVSTVARRVGLDSVFSLADLALTVPSALRLLVCYSRTSGTGTVSADASIDEPGMLVVEDLGPAPRLLGATVNDGSGGVVTPAPTAQTLTVTGSWTNPYSGSGTEIGSVNHAWQGQTIARGMRKSMIGFPELTALAGATIQSVTLRLYAAGWVLPDGGAAVVGFHSYLAEPTGSLTTLTSYTADIDRTGVWTGLGFGFITLTGHAPQEWVTGAKRGIYLGLAQGVTDTSGGISGQFAGALDADTTIRPQLTFTYTV